MGENGLRLFQNEFTADQAIRTILTQTGLGG
jgi:hypothetical protein